MPTITLSDTTDAALKLLARPFDDTRESLIARLIHEEVARRGINPNGRNGQPASIVLDPDVHASLTHTRLVSATVDGRSILRPKWNSLMDYLHTMARQRLGSFGALKRATSANVREGRYELDGYHYLSDADLSIQGSDANGSWNHTLKLARAIGVALEAKFEWRDKDDAAHPGESGTLRWNPTGTTSN